MAEVNHQISEKHHSDPDKRSESGTSGAEMNGDGEATPAGGKRGLTDAETEAVEEEQAEGGQGDNPEFNFGVGR